MQFEIKTHSTLLQFLIMYLTTSIILSLKNYQTNLKDNLSV